MAKKNRGRAPEPRPEAAAKAATLKDLLPAELVDRLKNQASDMRAEQERVREEERQRAEEARKAEQKRNESSMEYLLENSSMDWKSYK
ncbi:YqkE family protein [Paenibacillus albicereus]|uniref:YqkE family protein n=1 Tax=Paenibacillus albicereus TaxID=2726185 RepID=A0A6H2H0I5_9BACL|nr:DUF3886 domain-containing protein [Paenibacillus albicereus]QJC53162.1 YqkE family protein [Paenibacillus albicereus]